MESQQCQQEEETYVRMGREEGGQTAGVVRIVTFEEKTEECGEGQVPAVSPEKCSTPSDTGKHTPIVFSENPESPDPSPLRADMRTQKVGNSPQLAGKSARSPSESMTDSFVDSFVASLLEEQCTTAAAAEAVTVPVVKQESSSDSLEVNVSNSSTAETPSIVERECIICRSMFDVLPSEEKGEMHLCEMSPVSRVYSTRRCWSPKINLSRRNYCVCRTRCDITLVVGDEVNPK